MKVKGNVLSSTDSSVGQMRLSVLVACVSALQMKSVGRFRLAEDILLAIAIMTALCMHDRPTSMHQLLRSNKPAFGLVVNRRQLCCALDRVLAGEQGTEKLELYKASMCRITQTIAVSYRWQPEGVTVAPGLALNMSMWQLRCLRDVLLASSCPYVWIDKLAVPQAPSSAVEKDAQHKLLSRMNAVYTLATATVALRSQETEGNRYHQRG
jgi:hypothetical protein